MAVKRNGELLQFIKDNPSITTSDMMRMFSMSRDSINRYKNWALGADRDITMEHQRAGIDDPESEFATMVIEGFSPEQRALFDQLLKNKFGEIKN